MLTWSEDWPWSGPHFFFALRLLTADTTVFGTPNQCPPTKIQRKLRFWYMSKYRYWHSSMKILHHTKSLLVLLYVYRWNTATTPWWFTKKSRNGSTQCRKFRLGCASIVSRFLKVQPNENSGISGSSRFVTLSSVPVSSGDRGFFRVRTMQYKLWTYGTSSKHRDIRARFIVVLQVVYFTLALSIVHVGSCPVRFMN